MSYGADFPAADPANAPLDAPIFIGADPALWAVLILAVLLAGLAGWVLRGQSTARGGDASESIWKAIDAAAKDAMKADDNALKGRAEHLRTVIDARLGKVLIVAGGKGGLATRVATLDKAIEGKRPAEKKDAHGTPGHGHGEGHEQKHDDHGGAEGHGQTAGAAAAAAAASIVINVAPSASPPTEKPDHGGHPPHPPAQDDQMTTRQQIDAPRLAVAAFNEHWRPSKAREKELQEALDQLSGEA